VQKDDLVRRLIDRHGRLFSEEIGVDLSENTPSPLFRWLCAALLLSARIPHRNAVKASRALADAGMTTARHMVDTAWKDRVAVLSDAGYGRFDESTARMLGDTAELLEQDYDGDLRKLRDAADRDPKAERAAVMACKGIGEVGADIFLREMQAVWPENHPFADGKALAAAKRLGLPETAEDLAALVDRKQFPTLIAALVRAELAGTTTEDLSSQGKKTTPH